jgi:preprotein translocase subunit SecB
MGVLPQALENIFEVQRKRSNQKKKQEKKELFNLQIVFFFFFSLFGFQISELSYFLFIYDNLKCYLSAT